MQRLATIVRAADTARLDLSPEAPGLLAASLGLSRMFDDGLDCRMVAGQTEYHGVPVGQSYMVAAITNT